MVVANVDIWGVFAGAVLWDAQTGTASFESHRGFAQQNRELAPLTMPLR